MSTHEPLSAERLAELTAMVAVLQSFSMPPLQYMFEVRDIAALLAEVERLLAENAATREVMVTAMPFLEEVALAHTVSEDEDDRLLMVNEGYALWCRSRAQVTREAIARALLGEAGDDE
jgi:hypothetical protein